MIGAMTKNSREYQPVEEPEGIPSFSSEDEEAKFWATHELGDGLLSRMQRPREGLLPVPRPPAKPISLRIDQDVLAAVKRVAHERDMPYQTLLKELLVKQLAIEDDPGVARPSPAIHSARIRKQATACFARSTDARAVCRRTDAIRKRRSVLVHSP